jgi:tetratricopeptide (TPR) repeat protein
MEPTSTPRTVPAQRSGSPGTGILHPFSARPQRRERSSPSSAAPQWHTGLRTLGPGDARAAERLLRSTALAPATGPALLHATRVLLHTGNPHRAVTWCAKLHPHARTPAWTAAFRALRAEALLQLGELTAAENEAARALDAAGPRPGTLRLWPTAVRAEALITLGRYEEAAAHLDSPAPAPLWSAAPWFRARGRLHLAVHRYQDALDTFRFTGRLALRHGTGRLPHLPWRGDVAETLLRFGRTAQARALLTEELALPALGPRHRATALRLLAATDEPARRPHTLACAIGELRRCKDRVELARTMAGLAHALDVLGDSSTTAFLRRATDLAANCGLSSAALATP